MRERAFVVEGPKALRSALDCAAPLEALYCSSASRRDEASLRLCQRADGAGVPIVEVADQVMERVSATVTPQGVLAVAKAIDVGVDAVSGGSPVLVCVDVRDPGNLGTLIRSAAAAGVQGIVCCGGTADVYNPKVVRASAGGLFSVPVAIGQPARATLEQLRSWGFSCLGSKARGGADPSQSELGGRVAIVLGNEATGLPPALGDAVDGWLSIPMAEGAESLNVGVAGSVICFEAARQRRAARPERTVRPLASDPTLSAVLARLPPPPRGR